MSDLYGPTLRDRLSSAVDHDYFDVNIFVKGEPAAQLLSKETDGLEIDVISALEQGSRDLQRSVLNWLASAATTTRSILDASDATEGLVLQRVVSPPTPFWINNAIGVEVTRDVLQELASRDDIQYIELSQHVDVEELIDGGRSRSGTSDRASSSETGADSPVAWSVSRIGAPHLWKDGLRGAGVLVAVLDTGTNYTHPDLRNRMWDGGEAYPNHGYDFENDDNDPMDEHGHGTATAGQVAGDGSAGHRTGVAPEATIMAIRVGGTERNYWNAFEFAVKNGAHVISMSMSWKYPRKPNYPGWRRACESLLAAGVLHANSIGNQGSQLGEFPIPYNIAAPGNCPPPRLHPLQAPMGGLSSAISCGATDSADRLASYSGRGPAAWETGPFTDYPYASGTKPGLIKPDICAPGPGTRSCNWRFGFDTHAKPYRSFGGTSAATPHVGGCLALLAQACLRSGNAVDPARIQEALENTAVRVVGQAVDKESHYGAGRIDVYVAYKYGAARKWWA